MYSELILSHLQKDVTGTYFELCRYFLTSHHGEQAGGLLRLGYYQSLMSTEASPIPSPEGKLDLEIISATKDVKQQLLQTYPAEFIIRIIYSGIHVFFDKMERYAAIDVRLRSTPELYGFFTAMTPVVISRLKQAVHDIF